MNYRKAKSQERYTIFAPDRVKRPSQNGAKSHHECFFCPENLNKNVVVDTIEGNKGWQVVSIQNKFPISDFHEVVIHSPNHNLRIENMTSLEVGQVFKMYAKRFEALKDKGRVVIFCNFGKFAGASMEHPHSQIMVIDKSIKLNRLDVGRAAAVIAVKSGWEVFTPEYSEYPYEVWIKSDKKFTDFGEEDFLLAGELLQKTVKVLITHLSEFKLFGKHYGKPHIRWKEYGPAYNFYLNTEGEFHIRIIPKLSIQAGFELATGINVNVSDPKVAGNLLKSDFNK